ncbi:zinc finger protein 280D-like [Macrosteles quadrilineatus]|uniref:zinc finger protein 280D-like n=1 Tax=Macrosteles quadrilineatus TaxID=74068 RepID=UPI0023E1EA02|nr:zinc finger protein 280D-like [Macrosteles quadrilineatus]XP_054273292.1 zinc finger protein 280D-like [Macrosteles quadrilineatus]
MQPGMSNPGAIRQRGRFTRFTCQICDKVFATQETLNQHVATHRSPGKLPFRCNLCNAQYPSRQGLDQHKLTYHRNAGQQQGSEMVAPVVDINKPGVIEKLASVGIRHYISLSQISGQPNGIYGMPIVSIDSARNPAQSNSGRGDPSTLSLGPPKPIR